MRTQLGQRPRIAADDESPGGPSLIRFVVLSYLLAWVVWIPGLVSGRGSLVSPRVFLTQTIAVAIPSLLALRMVRRAQGDDGVRWITSRYRIWRVGFRWYLSATLIAPGISLLALAIRSVGDPTFSVARGSPLGELLADIGPVGMALMLPLMTVGLLFSSPLLEELAWRGFALPRIQDRFEALTSSLLLGVLWGGWHLPLFVASGESVVLQLLQIVAVTVLITWVVNSTRGSMLLAMVFHASLVVSLVALKAGPVSWVEVTLTWAAAIVVIAAFGRRDLSRSRRTTWPPP